MQAMDINLVFPNAIAENLKGVIVLLYGMIPMMSLSLYDIMDDEVRTHDMKATSVMYFSKQ